MAFDGIVLSAVLDELRNKLLGGRIDKIQQPTNDDLILIIRSQRINYRLLLSSNKAHPRIHLSTHFVLPNPSTAPMMCMLMRKHLEGGRITAVTQFGRERIAAIDIDTYNELGDSVTRRLMIEIMGKHSNIALLTEPDGMIIDATNHTSANINRHREVLPGKRYVYPPDQAKRDPFLEQKQDFISQRTNTNTPLGRFLVDHYVGISPFFGKEVAHRASINHAVTASEEWEIFAEALWLAKQDQSAVVFDEHNRPIAFYVFTPQHLSGFVHTYQSISEAIDIYYQELAISDVMRSKSSNYLHLAKNEMDKNRNKINKLATQLASQDEADTWRLQGELITAYLYQLKKGEVEVTLPNFYDNNVPLTISMDPAKTPLENANSYFKRYQKFNKGRHKTEEQLQLASSDLAYWESVVHELESSSIDNLPAIEAELREAGILKKNTPIVNLKNKKSTIGFATFYASDGTPILVGRNNKENDHLTFKIAKKSDIWLHVKDAPGSHVILRSTVPSEETLYEAALVAAYFSKLKESAKAPVDVVPVKDLWKPNHAKPGFVLFTGQRTLMVPMDEALIQIIMKNSPH